MATDKAPIGFLWVDLEMTGLDPQTHRIIEVAAVVTNTKLEPIEQYASVIKQSDHILGSMEEFSALAHAKSGLTELSRSSAITEAMAEEAVLKIANDFFGDEPVYLAGNSIHQDRLFIKKWWPKLESRLHYRMLDVTSLKLLLLAQGIPAYNKAEAHRATGDIEESIAELKYCLAKLSAIR